jgi:DNA helicase-2/ATP-dependent DNA helicase PcrA
MGAMDILSNLNPQQREAVTAGLGQILVLAGPGSRKTRVLTQRIAYLIQTMEVPPFHILAVTFTNKAAREMEHRLGGSLGNQLEGIWLGTFHSVCARLLRREAN